MHRTGSFGYAETAGGQTLEIRYAGTGLAFDILLPKKGEKLDAAEARYPGLARRAPRSRGAGVPPALPRRV